MNVEVLGKAIIENLGGTDNVKSISHCATRLRVTLNDADKFEENKIKNLDGVLGLSKFDDQYQIIIGPGVANLYKTILSTHEFENLSKQQVEKAKKKNLMNEFLQILSGCVAPLVPAITAAGFIKVILVILSLCGVLDSSGQTYMLLDQLSGTVFYFMPILIAYTASEKLGCSKILAVAIVALLVYPDFITLVGTGEAIKLFGFIPVASVSYGGSIVPSLLTVYVLSVVEKFIDRIIPDIASVILKPLLVTLIVGVLMLVIIGPLGYYIGYLLVLMVNTMYDTAGWLCLLVLCVLSPFLGMTGMHLGLMPVAIATLAADGYERVVLIVFFVSTISNGAAALSVFFKTKNLKLKQAALSASIATLVGGVGEPSLFAINTRLKRPIYAVMIGAGIAGIFAGVMGLKAFAFGAYSVVSVPAFISEQFSNNFVIACATAAISIIVTFVATWIIGFDDSDYGVEGE